MRILIGLILFLTLLNAGCNLVGETKDDVEQGGAGAVGLAEKMSGGTVGNTDEETGEPADAEDDVEQAAGEISGE
ncbi:hypothetical protein JW859_09640 [bacterium]|nr:hypothetical protein [bacterium]